MPYSAERHLKHEVAYYEWEGKLKRLRAEQLRQDPTIRLRFLKNKVELFTDETKSERLYMRRGGVNQNGTERSSHFYCRAGDEQRNDDIPDWARKDISPAHNQRIKDLLSVLNRGESCRPYRIGYNHYFDGEPQFTDLADARKYMWMKEQKQQLSTGVSCRFDIVGRRRDTVCLTKADPMIAIEVINTSFPSDKTLEAQKIFSRIQPIVIFYDVLARKNYFFNPAHRDKDLPQDEDFARGIFYVYNGNVYQNEKPIPSCDSVKLKDAIECMVDNRKREGARSVASRAVGYTP
jgi:hypothetical protein